MSTTESAKAGHSGRSRVAPGSRQIQVAYESSARMKLAMHPVPSSLWQKNLRNELGKTRWTRLRKAIIEVRGLTCEICQVSVSQSKDIQAHEAWTYTHTAKRGIAKLERIALVCRLCHAGEHFALTEKLVSQGSLREQAIDDTTVHFCKLNGISRDQFKQHYNVTMTEWEILSAKQWDLDWGVFAPLVASKQAGEQMAIPDSVFCKGTSHEKAELIS